MREKLAADAGVRCTRLPVPAAHSSSGVLGASLEERGSVSAAAAGGPESQSGFASGGADDAQPGSLIHH